MRIRHTVLASIAASLLFAVGCGFEGDQGNLKFNYKTDPGVKTPLAVNSNIRVETYYADSDSSDAGMSDTGTADTGTADAGGDSNGGSDPADLSSVTSSDSSVIAVSEVGSPEANAFRLEAKKSGSVTIDVKATRPDGTTVSDSFDLEAKKASKASFDHACTNDENSGPPVYLTNQKAPVKYDFESSGGDALTGWGYYPFTLSGSSSATLVTSREDASNLAVETGTMATTLSVAPDSSISGSKIDLTVKSESKIDKIEWFGGSSSDPQLLGDSFSDDGGLLLPQFEIAGDEVCRGIVGLSVTNNTTSVCEVSVDQYDIGEAVLFRSVGTYLEVKAKKEGTCKFDLTVDKASNLTKSISLELEK